MDSKIFRNPIVTTSTGSDIYAGIPEVTNISYDLWILRITLRFENINCPVYVLFDGIIGFRVLDEGDLLEFWRNDSRAEGWLWAVQSGGWFDLEKFREGFVSMHSVDYNEFLVIGIDACVSVIAHGEPKVEMPKP